MTISVIIPTYNEEDNIVTVIETVKEHSLDDILEIIVVDGGSRDKTIEKAESVGAVVFESPEKGRAAQMNYGAGQADGDLLYFLHADSLPPENFISLIKEAVQKDFQAGCFQLEFDQNHFLLNFYAWFTRFDVDVFRFGDQSLFITRTAFRKIGGFREDHIVMEDNEIVRRIKRHFSFKLLGDSVITSARKYEQIGILKLQLVFIGIFILYHCGADQKKLIRIYKKMIR